MIYLRQSTASQEIPLGVFVDETDGFTAESGLTIANTDIKIWKTGATTLANKNSGGATNITGGRYYAVLDATDTDTIGPMEITVHVAGARPVRVECFVLTAAAYDALIAGDLSSVQKTSVENAVWDASLTGASHNTANSAGKRLRQVSAPASSATGTAQAGGASTITLDAGESSVNDFYVPGLVVIESGTGAVQFRRITEYNGTTKVATVSTPWATQPDNTSGYVVTSWASVRVSEIESAAANTVRDTILSDSTSFNGASIPSAAAGSAGGLLIAGSNAATTFAAITVSGATTLTGNISFAGGITGTQSTANASCVSLTGNGTGDGIRSTGGATGRGIAGIGGSSSGDGIVGTGTSGHGIRGIGAGSAKYGILGTAGTNASGIGGVGNGNGHGILLTAGASGKGFQADSLVVSGTTALTGAVSLGSTLAVTGTTTLAALTTTGAVTFNSFTPNFATDVITSGALAASAVTEIQAGLATSAEIAALNDLSAAEVNAECVDALATDVIADSVPADGTRPSVAQAAYMILQFLTEASISGTTVTVKKVDGSTTLTTYTINSSTAPTSITRAT